MIRRTEPDSPQSRSLLAVNPAADPFSPADISATSILETVMHLVPEQVAHHHIDHRHREAAAWRVRRVALAVRKAEAADRRARLAREAAVLATREAALVIA